MNDPLTLEQTAALISGHVRLEQELFRLTGLWSADPGAQGSGSEDPAAEDQGASIAAKSQALFGAESAQHGWRAEQWDQRRVRSLDADTPESAVGFESDPIIGVIEDLFGQELRPTQRLAAWGYVLAPTLAAHYLAHRSALAPAADGGLDRWLDICITDVNRGSTEAVMQLGCHTGGSGAPGVTESVRTALSQILGH